MYRRLDEVPTYESYPTKLDAVHYNHVQHALKHLGDSIRLQIPRLKHLDLILERQAWIIVDRALNDVPVAAWTDFETGRRDNLHQPVPCRQRLYHAHAQMVLDHTIEAMELMLGELMQDENPGETASVTPISKD